MPSPKLISLLLMAACAHQAAANEARTTPAQGAPALDESARQASTPDEARIVSDLKDRYAFMGVPAAGAAPAGFDEADATAIRSSVRKGDVLEYRVSTIFHARSSGHMQREVDTIVSYQMDAGQWALQDVQWSGSRDVAPGEGVDAAEDC